MYDGVEVLQSAAVECIDELASSPRSFELGVEQITVLQFKDEVWSRSRSRNALALSQLAESGKLMEGD